MEIENKEENRRKRNRSGDDDDTDCEGSKATRKDVMDIASSSSSTAAPADADADDTKKYDVFISFRGEDTRRTFTSHLHAALLEKKITTYIDDKLKRGDEIAPALLQAIKESELSVIIFSKDYASSTWCLDELVHILACKEKHGQLVIPIFYDTLPSDVRKQRGSYEVAFAQLEQRFQNSIDKVHKWRDALTNAADISGFDSKNYGTDADLVKKVVEDIWTKLCRASSCDLKGFVGIESRIEQVESLLGIHSSDACITVGIWGMGGIGKTTLAETIFHKLSSKFEASCFVKNVRENSEKAGGLDHLETTLLKEILKEEGLSIRPTIVQKRLRCTKVLIVLDDVSSSMQIERLAGDPPWYGTGSIIIITTRDRGTLGKTVKEDNIYEVEVLKPDDALQLFCSCAFKNNSTRIIDCKELAEKAVAYAKGLPLALTVLGSLFFNCKSKEEWEDVFNKLKRFPSEDIQKVLRISYDRLGENEKEIFLDIACFHTGESLVEVKQMLDARGFFATDGIRILKDMSLISIDSELETIPVDLEMDDFPQEMGRETIVMHDLLQEMGRKIVQEEGNKDPGKRSRLFNGGDVCRVLSSNMETPNVEVIKVDWRYIEKPSLKHVDFKKMSNLEMLIVQSRFPGPPYSLDLPDSLRYLEWRGYHLESLPSKFSPENLVELHMPKSGVKELWKEAQILVNLQVIDLSNSKDLTEVPNLSRSLKIVKIKLRGCKSLVEIPSYFQHLDKLIHLNLGYCRSLKYLPKMPGSIQYLNLECTGIKELPESVWSNENISYLNITNCGDLEKLPSNSCKLKASNVLGIASCKSLGEFSELPRDITKLSLVGFKRLVSLPNDICNLKYLEELDLSRCSRLENFPEILEPMEHLKVLNLSGTAVKELPSSIEFLPGLKIILLRGCYRLSSIPKSICKLKCLEELDLFRCSELENFPEILEPMEHLKFLNLSGTAVKFKWRDALTTAAMIKADLIQKVVDDIWIQLCRESSCDLNGFVGIEGPIKQIEWLLGIHSQRACITVCIWGMGGIGKTTLAEAVFRKHSSTFEASCFLKNVTENSEQAGGLDHLEKTLLKEILKEEVLPLGSTLVRERLSRTKVLIVLDDVSSSMQMERLAGDRLRYGTGSRIIITTRDRSTLGQTVEEDYIYEVEVLKPDDALQLFCSRASKNKSTRRTDYKESAEKVVHYARGVPLALTVLGSLFFNCKSKEEWEDEFNKLKRYPSESIQKVLRISYDRLERNEKEVFLDIACFFTSCFVDEVKRMLDVRGFFATTGIRILIDMSLISIDSKWGEETIEMHDLLQEMGRTIVQEQCFKDPCTRNRLINYEYIYRVLKSNMETPNVEAIEYSLNYFADRPLKCADFKLMSNLRLLIVIGGYTDTSLDLPDSLCYLEWCGCPLESLPSNFCPENLVELLIPESKVKELWKEEQILVNLQVIDLSNSYYLTEVPNLSGSLKIVEINLRQCLSLVEIPSYFQHLDKLTHLDLGYCRSLKYLPEMPGSIQYLDLQGTGIKELPESVWSNENISYLNISACSGLEKLPSNSCKLKASGSFNLDACTSLGEFSELPRDITKLSLVGCKRLVSLPNDICKLKYLEELNLSSCSELENFPEILEPMEHLKFLNLSGTAVKELPSSIEFLPGLKIIQLKCCFRLSSIPKSICKLKCLEELDIYGCYKLRNFPEILEPMENLKSLIISRTSVEQLYTSSIEFLPALENIELEGCSMLSCISKSMLKYVKRPDEYETSESDDHGSEASEIEEDADL